MMLRHIPRVVSPSDKELVIVVIAAVGALVSLFLFSCGPSDRDVFFFGLVCDKELARKSEDREEEVTNVDEELDDAASEEVEDEEEEEDE